MTIADKNANQVEAVTGVPFTLNGQELVANEGELLIDACDRNDVHIPRFCYHNRMKPVGMCRMCLVEVDTGRGPSLQPSCMLPVTPEMKVETETQVTKDAQDGVLELLLANHPLDCPVCDKGGECPLQDNAYAYGPGESRFVEEKRHFEKPIPISDLVNLDRERCILCDRCTRFASDVAGDSLIHFIDRGSQTQVNTFPDHPFASYFSGNTVQICPVGALTAEPYRFKARPWDLEATESTSTVDSSGARIVLQSSQDKMIRILGLDSDAVNWSWLSDKDRFIYEANNSEDRITQPLSKQGQDSHTKVRLTAAVAQTVEALRNSRSDRIGVIGGARAPLEGQYAWAKLFKAIVGTDNVAAQLGDCLPAPLLLSLPKTTIDTAFAPGSTVVLLGSDLKEDVPTLFLRLRHAVMEDGVKLIELTSRKTSLSELATVSIQLPAGTVGQFTTALLSGTASPLKSVSNKVFKKAAALVRGEAPVSVVLNRPNIAESPRYVADAVGAFRQHLPAAKFLPAVRRGNTIGAVEMGLAPGYLPGGVRLQSNFASAWPSIPEKAGVDTQGILQAAAAGKLETLVLLGADPLDDFPDKALAKKAFENVATVIAVDCFFNESVKQSDIILPVAMLGEVQGSFLNLEGRLSPLLAKVTAPDNAQADWIWAAEIASGLGVNIGFETLEELRSEISATVPAFADIDWSKLHSADDGPVLSSDRTWNLEFSEVASLPADPGYGLRLLVDHKLWDQGTMVANSSSLAGLAEDFYVRISPEDIRNFGLTKSDTVVIEVGSLSAEVAFVADARVPVGTLWAPVHLAGFDIRSFISLDTPVSFVRIMSLESTDG